MTDSFIPSENISTRSDFAVVGAYLDYFGLSHTFRSLSDFLKHTDRPSCMTEIADCVAQHGLQTTLMNADSELYNRHAWKKFLHPQAIKHGSIPALDTLETDRIMRKGVMIQRVVISEKLIDQFLENNEPLLIGYNPSFVHPLENTFSSHAILMKSSAEEYTLFEPIREHAKTTFPKKTIVASILGTNHSDPSAQSIILGREKIAPVDQDRELQDIQDI